MTVCYPFLELVPIRGVKEVDVRLFCKKSFRVRIGNYRSEKA